MRKLALVVALASTALAGPAFAKDKTWYVGLEGGGMLVEDSHFDLAGFNDALKVNHDTGFDVDGIVGYDLGMFRIEGEVGYKNAENDTLSVAAQAPPASCPAAPMTSTRVTATR
jgi:hypothetical protein